MEISVRTLHEDLLRLQEELAEIKKAVLFEGQLTPWAQKQLKKAREQKEETYVLLDDL